MCASAGEALALSGVASFVGAFLATWGLVFLAPLLVKVALLFGPAEYFALYLLAFATLGGICDDDFGIVDLGHVLSVQEVVIDTQDRDDVFDERLVRLCALGVIGLAGHADI